MPDGIDAMNDQGHEGRTLSAAKVSRYYMETIQLLYGCTYTLRREVGDTGETKDNDGSMNYVGKVLGHKTAINCLWPIYGHHNRSSNEKTRH